MVDISYPYMFCLALPNLQMSKTVPHIHALGAQLSSEPPTYSAKIWVACLKVLWIPQVYFSLECSIKYMGNLSHSKLVYKTQFVPLLTTSCSDSRRDTPARGSSPRNGLHLKIRIFVSGARNAVHSIQTSKLVSPFLVSHRVAKLFENIEFFFQFGP